MEAAGSSSNQFLTTLVLLLALSTYTSWAAPVKSSTEFIRTSCRATAYPKLCFKSLSSHATAIQTSPMLLAHTALSVTLDAARSTSTMMLKLSKTLGMKPREVAAMRDCVEELRDSVDQLRKSLAAMNEPNPPNFDLMINDIETWVSAALTDEDTCTDGFAGKSMAGNMKVVVRGKIVNIAHLTSNALALINTFAALHGYLA